MRGLWRWLALSLLSLILASLVYTDLSKLPAYPPNASRWIIITGVYGLIGTLAATAAVIIALADRVRRERPQIVLQHTDFTMSEGRLQVGPALVNVGGGPALGLRFKVTAPLVRFEFYEPGFITATGSYEPEESLHWEFVIDSLATNGGVGEPLVNGRLIDWLVGVAADLIGARVAEARKNEAAEENVDQLVGTRVIVEMQDVAIEVKYTDRGEAIPYSNSFRASFLVWLGLRVAKGRWGLHDLTGTIRPPGNVGLLFAASPTVKTTNNS